MPSFRLCSDSWIYGADTDPLKVQRFRIASRARANCLLHNATCAKEVQQFPAGSMDTFERLLMKVGEHTW